MDNLGWILWQVFFDIIVIFILNIRNEIKTKELLKDTLTVIRCFHNQTKIELTSDLNNVDKYNFNNKNAEYIDKIVKKHNLDIY